MSEIKNPTIPQYWQDVECKAQPAQGEFPKGFTDELYEVVNTEKSRREFLTVLGFTVAVPALTSCSKIAVTQARPFLNRETGTTPGVANWYASTCDGCEAHCGILVKTREGRPIKIEGNPDSFDSKGGTCAVGQATVLSLYDSSRLLTPLQEGKETNWEAIDATLPKLLREASSKGKIVLLTGRISSPSTLAVIAKFKAAYSNFEHLTFEPYSYSAVFESFSRSHGVKAVPRYDLSGVETCVSIGADFLGTWYAPVSFAKAYSAQRDVHVRKGQMLRHIQFESAMSVTGSNADLRIPVKASEESVVLAALVREMATSLGKSVDVGSITVDGRLHASVKSTVKELVANRGKSLVLSGSNRVEDQMLCNIANDLLGNIGQSVRLMAANEYQVSSDASFEAFVDEMGAGKVGALMTVDVNPAYAYYSPERWKNGIAKVGLKVSFSPEPNETSRSAHFNCPGNHFLESWNDHALGNGRYSLTQPTIQPLRATRMFQESLLRWAGIHQTYFEFLKNQWRTQLFPKQKRSLIFEMFWNKSVQDGVVDIGGNTELRPSLKVTRATPLKSNGLELFLYQKVGLRDGRHANNPWLQELPDPITKVSWDNYAMLSPGLAKAQGVKTGDFMSITAGGISDTLPVLVQPGLGNDSVAVAVGYGRTESGKAARGVGKNAYPFVTFREGTYQRVLGGVQLAKASGHYELALSQTHHVMEGRDIVREVSREKLHASHHKAAHGEHGSMWPEHKAGENRWGMAIDLNKCTGCSGCIVSCQAENNVPVVGRDEVRLRREMHWIRLDRYYTGDETAPGVVHQPILCHHCENAPCETVCPVLATVHSSDGLNQQVYNRCVGTRYCANNCPYKVRRFNWFEYRHDDPWERMVLNPDITVRSRGVMEKCSFCVQRIQEGRLRAKKEGRKVSENDFKVACQQSCPSDAIVFGDLADPNSTISKTLASQSSYRLMEELNVQPRVSFLPKVRNPL